MKAAAATASSAIAGTRPGHERGGFSTLYQKELADHFHSARFKVRAGTTVVFMMLFFVGIMVGGLGLAILGIPPEGEELLRLLSYLALTAVYT